MSMYTLDGKDLDDPQGRWVLESGTNLSSWGEPRLTSVDIPNKFGVIPIPSTALGAASVVLKFRVFSWKDGGVSRCKGTLVDVDENLRALVNRVLVLNRLPVLGFTPAGNTVRVADVRLKNALEPEYEPESLTASLTVTFEIPDGQWHDPNPTVQPLTDMKLLAGGTSPIGDAMLMLSPTGTEMVVTDVVSGSTLTWKGPAAIPATDRILVDVNAYTAYQQTSVGWDVLGNAKDVSGQISMSYGGFRLTPDTAGKVAVTVTGGSGYVSARRAY